MKFLNGPATVTATKAQTPLEIFGKARPRMNGSQETSLYDDDGISCAGGMRSDV